MRRSVSTGGTSGASEARSASVRAISARGTGSTVVPVRINTRVRLVHDIGLVRAMRCFLSVTGGRLTMGSPMITVRVDAGCRVKSCQFGSIARTQDQRLTVGFVRYI